MKWFINKRKFSDHPTSVWLAKNGVHQTRMVKVPSFNLTICCPDFLRSKPNIVDVVCFKNPDYHIFKARPFRTGDGLSLSLLTFMTPFMIQDRHG